MEGRDGRPSTGLQLLGPPATRQDGKRRRWPQHGITASEAARHPAGEKRRGWPQHGITASGAARHPRERKNERGKEKTRAHGGLQFIFALRPVQGKICRPRGQNQPTLGKNLTTTGQKGKRHYRERTADPETVEKRERGKEKTTTGKEKTTSPMGRGSTSKRGNTSSEILLARRGVLG